MDKYYSLKKEISVIMLELSVYVYVFFVFNMRKES